MSEEIPQQNPSREALFHIFVDNESILSDSLTGIPNLDGKFIQHRTTTKIPTITKVITPIGTTMALLLEILKNRGVLKFAANQTIYRLYVQELPQEPKSDETTKYVYKDCTDMGLTDPTKLYCLIPDRNLIVGDELKTAISNYHEIEDLKEKLNSQILTIAGLVFDIQESQDVLQNVNVNN